MSLTDSLQDTLKEKKPIENSERLVTRRHDLTKNIARGTTDPEIDSVTWNKFGNIMAPLALVANLATR